MLEQRVTVGDGGRLVIPSLHRKELGIKPGDEFIISLEDGELRFFRQKRALERLQAAAKAAQKPSNKGRETDNFLASRKKESGE